MKTILNALGRERAKVSNRYLAHRGAWFAAAATLLFFGVTVGCREGPHQQAQQDDVEAGPTATNAAEGRTVWRAVPGVGLGMIDDVCFVDDQRAWMTTKDWALLRTTDGGRTWKTVPLDRGDDAWNPLLIRLLEREDGSCYGWAVSTTGHIHHTSDGERWTEQKSPFTNVERHITCLDVLDENHAWVSGMGLNWRTTDGGKTWEHLSPPLTKDKTLPRWFGDARQLIHFRDKDHGTAIAKSDHAGWVTRTTSDGGKSWTTEKKRIPYERGSELTVFRSGRAIRVYAGRGPLVCEYGKMPMDDAAIARLLALEPTSDGDKLESAWPRQYAIVSEDVVAALETIHRYFIGGGKILTRLRISRDRGQRWTRVFLGCGPTALHFADRNHGWAVGPPGRVTRTTDGGETWSTQFLPVDTGFEAVYSVDQNTGWIAGSSQAPQAYAPKSSPTAPIWHTADGGQTWRPLAQIQPALPDALREQISRLLFKDRREGWAVTHALTRKPHPETNGATPKEYGRILHTVDGGRTWEQVYYGMPLENIARRADRFCAAGYGIAVSTGGRTWKNVASGIFFGVAFVDRGKAIDETEVIAVGEAGSYARSTNGGTDWEVVKRGVLQHSHLNAIAFAGPNTGWIAGSAVPDRHPGLFTTSDGGQSWSPAEMVWPERFSSEWSDLSVAEGRQAWVIGSSYGRTAIFRLDLARNNPARPPG